MPRATICVEVDDPRQVELGERWLAAHGDALDFLSAAYGCGCCVNLYNLEGCAELIASIPEEIRGGSDWASGGAKDEHP
jgi:hypothetical protein